MNKGANNPVGGLRGRRLFKRARAGLGTAGDEWRAGDTPRERRKKRKFEMNMTTRNPASTSDVFSDVGVVVVVQYFFVETMLVPFQEVIGFVLCQWVDRMKRGDIAVMIAANLHCL